MLVLLAACWGSGGHPGTRPSFFDDFGRLWGGTLVSMGDPWETRCGLLGPIGAPQAPFLMVFLRSSRGVSFFIGFWWPGLQKRGGFRGVRCGLYIVNNVSGAHVSILRKKLLSEAPRPQFYLPFPLVFGALGALLVHFGALLPPLMHFLHPLLHMPLHRCIFHGFWGPSGTPNEKSAATRRPSGG